MCVHDHDDIDTINIGRAPYQQCEGRCHRAMLSVTVRICCLYLSQPLLRPPMLSWYFPYVTSLRKINQGTAISCLEYLLLVLTAKHTTCFIKAPTQLQHHTTLPVALLFQLPSSILLSQCTCRYQQPHQQ